MKQARSIAVLIMLLVLAGCDATEVPDRDLAPDSTWTVVATAVDMKIAAIKATREVTGLGLKDAKELVDTVPSVIVSGATKTEADAAASTLREAGMTVEVRQE